MSVITQKVMEANIGRQERPKSAWCRLRHLARSSPVGMIGGVILFGLILMSIFAPLIAPYDPLMTNYGALKHPPSGANFLGTDLLGRDNLSRIIWGGRVSLFVGFTAVLLGDTVGLLLGLVSGYQGGRTDLVGQRVLDVLMSFPGLILAMMLLISMGAGLHTVIIAIAVTRIPGTARVIRSTVLQVKQFEFVEAARATGATTGRILWRHIGPQCIAPWLVIATAGLGSAIVIEAALSFMGVGVPPPTPTWGNMLGGIMAETFQPPWWLILFPGVALTITVLVANLFGDAVRDWLDPKLRD